MKIEKITEDLVTVNAVKKTQETLTEEIMKESIEQ